MRSHQRLQNWGANFPLEIVKLKKINDFIYICMHVNRASLMSQVKEFAWRCRRYKRCGFDPWVRKIPWEGNGYPLQYSCLESPKDRGIDILHSLSAIKESYMTKHKWYTCPYMYIYICTYTFSFPMCVNLLYLFLLGIKEPACCKFWKTFWMPLQMLQNFQNCFANHSFLIL